MDLTLAGISAFRFYRTPPQVLALLPPISQDRDYGRRRLYAHPLVREALGGLPLSCLATRQGEPSGARFIDWMLVQGELPYGSVLETELGMSATSPAMTLLTLARRLSLAKLAMAVYEMTGFFAVYAPSGEMDMALRACPPIDGSWRRVKSTNGEPSDLWQRRPLVGLDALATFAMGAEHLYGAKKMASAVRLVNGVAASPLEARLTALLTFPRRLGGCALKGFANNKRIVLGPGQGAVAGQDVCYVDFFHEGCKGGRPLAIECQGAVVHGSPGAMSRDANRALALQRMGYEVLQVTHGQVRDLDGYRELTNLIAERTGQRLPHRGASFLRAENNLRYELLSDWGSMFG